MNSKKLKIIVNAILFSILFFVIFGVVTVLIPNKFFDRMSPINYLDYIFLTLTSILLGLYVSLYIYQKRERLNKKCTASAVGGGFFGFTGFACSICDKILVLLLGVGGVLTYVEPYRPFIGSVGIGLMSYANYVKGKEIIK